jgi:hypothetical protein
VPILTLRLSWACTPVASMASAAAVIRAVANFFIAVVL